MKRIIISSIHRSLRSFSPFSPGTSAAQGPIKVGIVDTYTGPATTYTYDVRDAFKLAIDEVNAKGGVVGRKIEFTTRDDKFKVDLALSMAKELVMNEKGRYPDGNDQQRRGPGGFRVL